MGFIDFDDQSRKTILKAFQSLFLNAPLYSTIIWSDAFWTSSCILGSFNSLKADIYCKKSDNRGSRAANRAFFRFTEFRPIWRRKLGISDLIASIIAGLNWQDQQSGRNGASNSQAQGGYPTTTNQHGKGEKSNESVKFLCWPKKRNRRRRRMEKQ